MQTDPRSYKPAIREINGDLALNAVGLVRWLYELTPQEVGNRAVRGKLIKLQKRGRAQIAAQKERAGQEPEIQSVLNAVVNVDALNQAILSGDNTEALLAIVFAEPLPS